MVGSDKNQARCKKFEFDIKKDERPISFYGIVDKVNLKKRKPFLIFQMKLYFIYSKRRRK